jgi:RimJ/RimL family protein N-acetyltransferase
VAARQIEFPILTERLFIRPTTEADAAALHAVWGDPRVMGRPLQDQAATLDLLRVKIAQQERDGFSLWTVERRDSGEIVGTVGLQYEDGADVGLGFLFNPSAWGKGYGREASTAALRAGFEQLGLDRIIGITGHDNVPARRLMEAIGMTDLGSASYYGRDWALYEALAPSALPAPSAR